METTMQQCNKATILHCESFKLFDEMPKWDCEPQISIYSTVMPTFYFRNDFNEVFESVAKDLKSLKFDPGGPEVGVARASYILLRTTNFGAFDDIPLLWIVVVCIFLASAINVIYFLRSSKYIRIILGYGCQMENIAKEDCSLSGQWELGKLKAFYDGNYIFFHASECQTSLVHNAEFYGYDFGALTNYAKAEKNEGEWQFNGLIDVCIKTWHSNAIQEASDVMVESYGGPWTICGLLPLLGPPKRKSAETIRRTSNLEFCVKMSTIGQLPIAREIGRGVGIGTNMWHSLSLFGNDLIVANNINASELIHRVVAEYGVDVDENSAVMVIFHNSYAISEIEGDLNVIANDGFIKSKVILESMKTEPPALLIGIDHSLNPVNSLVLKVISTSPTTYSATSRSKLSTSPQMIDPTTYVQVPSVKAFTNFTINLLMGGVSVALSKTNAASMKHDKLLLQNQNETTKGDTLSKLGNGIGGCLKRTIKDEGIISLLKGNQRKAEMNLIHEFKERHYSYNFSITNTKPWVIKMGGSSLDAIKLLKGFSSKDIAPWTSINSTLVLHGKMKKMLQFFTKREEGIKRNEIIFFHGLVSKLGWLSMELVLNFVADMCLAKWYFTEGILFFSIFCSDGEGQYLSPKTLATHLQISCLKLGKRLRCYYSSMGFLLALQKIP